VLDRLPDGSYLSVVARPTLHDKARSKLISTARAGEHLDPAQAMRVRVIEYDVPGRDGDGELIALITTITDPSAASAQELAQAYCQRWERGDRQRSAEDLPARARRGAAVQEPRHGPPGGLRLPAHPPRHLGADLPGPPPKPTSSAAPGTTPSGSNDSATPAPATTDRPRSGSSTSGRGLP
jgi:hypothetical protein